MGRILYCLVGLVALCLSCQRSPLIEVEPETKNGIQLHLSIMERQEAVSRAAGDELAIDGESIYVLVFDGNAPSAKLLDFAPAFSLQSGGQSTYYIDLAEHEDARQAYVVVNAKALVAAKSVSWQKRITTLGEVGASLQTTPLTTVGNTISAMPTSHPMTGSCPLLGLTKQTSLGSVATPISLIPATVIVTVENHVPQGVPYTFTLGGASMGNAPQSGFVLPDQDVASIATHHYGQNGDVRMMMVGTQTIDGVVGTEQMVAYESAAASATFVILKAHYNGQEGYYKLGFYTAADKQIPRALLRGYRYKIVVRAVLRGGYASVDEALVASASNSDLVYDINVDDGDSYDIITNGAQYLGVSNSEYIAYNSNFVNEFEMFYSDGINNASVNSKLTPFTATTLTYTTDPSWGEGVVTASAGITLVDEMLAKVPSIPLPQPTVAGQPVRKAIRIFMDNEFRQGEIWIRIGDLQKRIGVRRELNFSVMGDSISLGRNIAYVSTHTLLDPTNPPKVDPNPNYGLSYSRSGTPVLLGRENGATDPSQELFLQVHNRFLSAKRDPLDYEYFNTYLTSYLYADIYLHHNTSVGRTKVSIAADMLGEDIMGDYITNPPISIAGAFWRNDQKGERLAQLDQMPQEYSHFPFPYIGRWQVRVVRGQDFIRIAEWDPALVWDGTKFPGDPESRPVTDGAAILHGKDCSIRFRIGLTSTNPGNTNRYGLIQVIYIDQRTNTNIYDQFKQSCLIFVRQGEHADHVLTPGKTYQQYGLNATGSFVAPDVQFAAYPLIDPKLGAGGADIADHTSITATDRPVFAPYPSYADYMFQWGGDRIIHSANPQGAVAGWDNSLVENSFKEHCPPGYITPPSHIDGTLFVNGLRSQFPRSSGNLSFGFYLDGYQDRYIHITKNSTTCAAPYTSGQSARYMGTSEECAAYFNPETMASVYIQGFYAREGATGEITDYSSSSNPVLLSGLWARSMTDKNKPSVVGLGRFSREPLSFYDPPAGGSTEILSAKSAFSVRCIKDPATP